MSFIQYFNIKLRLKFRLFNVNLIISYDKQNNSGLLLLKCSIETLRN